MKIYFTLLFTICHFFLLCQSPAIKEAKIKWYFCPEDKGYGTNGIPYDTLANYDSKSSIYIFESKQNEDFVYLNCPTINDNGNVFGGAMYKIDSQEGNVIWENYFNKWTKVDTQENFIRITLNSDQSEVCLLGARNKDKEGIVPPWIWGAVATPCKRCFDIETGELTSYLHDRTKDEIKYVHQDMYSVLYSEEADNQYYLKFTDNEFSTDTGSIKLILHPFDDNYTLSNNTAIDSLTLKIPSHIQFGGVYGFNSNFRLNNDTYIYAVTNLDQDSTISKSTLFIAKYNENELYLKKQLDLLKYHRIQYQRSDFHYTAFAKNQLLISGIYNDTITNQLTNWILWLDDDGEVIQYYPSVQGLNNEVYTFIDVIQETEEKIYLLGTIARTSNTFGNIFSLSKNGEYTFESTVTGKDSTAIRFNPVRSSYNDKGDFFKSINYNDVNYLIALNLKDFGIDLPSKTTESELIQSKIYPNPSYGIINIEMDGLTTDHTISIYNTMGQEIYRKRSPNYGLATLNINTVNPGIYYVIIQDENQAIIDHQKVVLIR